MVRPLSGTRVLHITEAVQIIMYPSMQRLDLTGKMEEMDQTPEHMVRPDQVEASETAEAVRAGIL